MQHKIIIYDGAINEFSEILSNSYPHLSLDEIYAINCGKGFKYCLKFDEFHKMKSKIGLNSFFDLFVYLLSKNYPSRNNVCISMIGFDLHSVEQTISYIKKNNFNKLNYRIFLFVDDKTFYNIASINKVQLVDIDKITIKENEYINFNIQKGF